MANATGMKVVAGPIEGTSLGNALMQFVALGAIKDVKEARQVVANSFEISCFEPHDTAMWDEGYEKFTKIVEMTKNS